MTIRDVTIATERPVTRKFGEERLRIRDDSVVLGDFKSTGVPLLDGHDSSLRRLGTVVNPRVRDGKLLADIVFDRTYGRSRELFESIKQDGVSQDLSVGYMVRSSEMVQMGESTAESHTVTKFEVIEVSVVGRGADRGSGFLRVGSIVDDNLSDSTMTADNASAAKKVNDTEPKVKASAEPAVQTRVATPAANKSKPASAVDLMDLGDAHNIERETVKTWIRSGITLADAKDQVLDAVQKRAQTREPVRFADNIQKDEGNLKDGKVEYSMRGAIDLLVSNKLGEGNLSPEASLARDVSKDFGGGDGFNVRVPFNALRTRSFEASDSKQGQKIITDQVDMSEFQRFLYNTTVMGRLGIKTLTGLTDNVVIPVQSKSVTANYVSESASGTVVDMEASNITLSPKVAIGLTKITNLAKAQMPAIQGVLQDDLLTQLRIAVDRTTLIGGGSGEPTGIMATSGVNTARTGSSKASTRKVGIDEVLDVVADIQTANVQGNPKIVAPPALINYWRKLKTTNGDYIWTQNTDMTTVMNVPGYLFGIPVYASTNLRNAGDATTDHRLLIGVFEYAYAAFWGNSFNLEIGTSGSDFASDQASIRATVYHDTGVARSAAFKSFTKIEV